jgi:hypothetical protein
VFLADVGDVVGRPVFGVLGGCVFQWRNVKADFQGLGDEL